MGRIDPPYPKFGELFRKHRESMHLTQEDVSKMVGLSRTSIANIEAGRQKVLLHQLYDLAAAVQVPPSALLPPIETNADSDRQVERAIAALRPKIKDPSELEWIRKTVSLNKSKAE
jgi:transcriptional regulator with XRE-family HTH domain